MTINLADNDPRIEYTVADGNSQQVFTVPFEFFDDGDLNVYQDGTLKTLTTHYLTADNNNASSRVAHTSGTTGFIHFTTGNVPTASGADIKIVITRSIDIERTTDFPSSGPFDVGALNTALDKVIAIQADLQDDISRSLRLTDFDLDATLTLPAVDSRKGTVLAFNSTTGAAEAGPQTGNVNTIASISTDIDTVAGIAANVTTVAGINANVTTVAGISSNVTTVAGVASDVTSVAGNTTNINTVAGNNTNINTVAGVSSDVTTVAGISANVTTVAGIQANVTTVAGISSDVTSVANIASNVTTVAGINTTHLSNVSGVASNVALLGTTAAISDLNTLAAISTDITSLADSLEKTYVVTVAGGVFVLDGVNNPAIEMFRGNTYIFDVSDSSVAGHPLAFKDGSGNSWTTGVTTTGTAGQAGAKVTFEVPSTAPSSMRYYCTVHGNSMGNTITVKDSNISLVASNIANINTVAGIDSNVTTVAGISANVTTVAGIQANVSTVAGIQANVTSVAGVASDVTSVANISANVTSVAGVASSVPTVAGISSDVSTVAGISSNVTTVAGVASDVTTVAGNSSNVTTVAGSITNVNNVGGSIANVNTVASNLSGVNSFGERYRVSANAPTTSLDAGDLWFDTTNNIMKVYGSSGFANAGSSVNGTSNRADFVVGTSSGAYTGSTTVFPVTYDAGFVDVYLNGIKLQPADFTATNGTSVTLGSAAQTNDTVSLVAFGTFNVANFSINDANDVNTGGVSNGQVLAFNSSTSDFEPTTISSDLVSDTSPQLGGTLDTNGQAIQFGSSKWTIELSGDNLLFKYNGTAKIKFASDGEIVTVDDVTAFGTI